MKAIRLQIRGRVQGVGFRYFAQEEAAALQLTGWVRNCPDGSVEAHAEGEESALEKWTDRLRQGPPLSRVDSVQLSESTATGDDSTFTIR